MAAVHKQRNSGHLAGNSDPVSFAKAITPGSSEFTWLTKGIHVSGAGTVVGEMLDPDTNDFASVTFTVIAGLYYPYVFRKITSSTTATGIIGLY